MIRDRNRGPGVRGQESDCLGVQCGPPIDGAEDPLRAVMPSGHGRKDLFYARRKARQATQSEGHFFSSRPLRPCVKQVFSRECGQGDEKPEYWSLAILTDSLTLGESKR
jgi:hypothetical protein